MKKLNSLLIVGLLFIGINVFADDVRIDSDGNVNTGLSRSGNLEVTGASAEKAIVGIANGTGGAGVYGINTTTGNYGYLGWDNWAGYFSGDARITGNLTIDGSIYGPVIGDITGVTAGTGLSGGGMSTDVTINADTTYLQRRVSSLCTVGSSIRAINENGTVECQTDNTGITAESDPEVGSNTNDFIPKWDGSALITGTIFDNGNVGIGTTDPSKKLTVAGTIKSTSGGIEFPDGTVQTTSVTQALCDLYTLTGSTPLPSFCLRNLTIVKTGSGTGTVNSDLAGIDCGSDCTEDYYMDTIVTLTAIPDTEVIFTGWSGSGCSGTGTCAVTMDTNKTVTANFYASGSFRLPDSGQTICYRTESPYDEIPCAGTGQDGEYSINPPSFTDYGNGTVKDNNTGLIWQKQDDGTAYNWYQASGIYDASYNPSSENVCGTLALGGYSDWRLPDRFELMGIVNYGLTEPAVDETVFPMTEWGYAHWSANAAASDPTYVWHVNFYWGTSSHAVKTISYTYVRCVRGEQNIKMFTDNGDSTVSDNITGLMWQQEDDNTGRTWETAITYCENMTLGTYSDWRLPNIKELSSIADLSRYNPAIDNTIFPNTSTSNVYWSSTHMAQSLDNAWGHYYSIGYVGLYAPVAEFNARCVRGG